MQLLPVPTAVKRPCWMPPVSHHRQSAHTLRVSSLASHVASVPCSHEGSRPRQAAGKRSSCAGCAMFLARVAACRSETRKQTAVGGEVELGSDGRLGIVGTNFLAGAALPLKPRHADGGHYARRGSDDGLGEPWTIHGRAWAVAGRGICRSHPPSPEEASPGGSSGLPAIRERSESLHASGVAVPPGQWVHWRFAAHWESENCQAETTGSDPRLNIAAGESSYCSFAYSALACLRIGMSGSASFHKARNV